MYNSPIELMITDIQNQILKQQDDQIYQATLHYVPNVDKEELLRALKYDRNQYDKGYADGIRDAREELVRCKYCKHCEPAINSFGEKIYDKEWFVFPFAIAWYSRLYYITKPTSRLTIHFLWWHWRWDFERKVDNG